MQISELWAWVCTEPDGGEGIPAARMGEMVMPLVGADRARIESFRPLAQEIADEMRLPIKLVRFFEIEVVEHIAPNKSKEH